jgi:hypothetical protein
MKSQKGQYMSPLLMVGIISRFNLAMISGIVSPVNHAKQAIRGQMSVLARKVAQEKFPFEGILHARLSENSFSRRALQYIMGRNVYYMQNVA